MKNQLPHAAVISILLEDAYRAFLQNAPADLLAKLTLKLCLGIRIRRAAKATCVQDGVLTISFVRTKGDFKKPNWDDWEPDRGLIDYVPDSEVIQRLSFGECLARWHVGLPDFSSCAEGKNDSRQVKQLQHMITANPGVRRLAIARLEARIDDGVKQGFFDIAETWLYNIC